MEATTVEVTVSKLSAEAKKAAILELANAGEKRPNQKSELGNAIANYTNPTNGSFDATFTDALKAANPKWFRSPRKPKAVPAV